jgi:hypothetical protein
VAVKVAEEEPATTVTEGGTVSSALLLASATTIPPFGAAPLNATVHVVAAPEFTPVGLHTSEESVTDAPGATKLIVADREMPLGTIAEASFEYTLSAPVLSTVVPT